MGKLLLIVVIVFGLSSDCLAKIYSKCELATALENVGMDRPDIRNFVCIASVASKYDSQTIETIEDEHKAYGLFQIHNKFWCDDVFDRNKCDMSCEDLLDEKLTDDVECIKKIIQERETWDGMGSGLSAWDAYVNVCQQTNLKEFMAECWSDTRTVTAEKDSSQQETTNERESSQSQPETTNGSESSQSQPETTNGSESSQSQPESTNESESSQSQPETTNGSESSQSQPETTNKRESSQSQKNTEDESKSSQSQKNATSEKESSQPQETINESESPQSQQDTRNEDESSQSQQNSENGSESSQSQANATNGSGSSQSEQETTNESESSQSLKDIANESKTSQKDSTSESEKAGEANENRPVSGDLETADSSVVYMLRAPVMHQPIPYVHHRSHPQIYQKTYH